MNAMFCLQDKEIPCLKDKRSLYLRAAVVQMSLLSQIGVKAFDPREGDETETSERGGGSKGRIFTAQGDPRPGDETTPIRESPLRPPVRV
jgi:hypothetical protein